ncbi:MAG: ImmA/IrrE family metallo-endopeptidase [Solirubrobacterales bacterium]
MTIDKLPDGLSGALLLERGSPFVFINGADHPVRQRFTLAHEFGHLRLGHGEVVDGPEAFTSKARHPHEVAANYFASEFLAPVSAVRRWAEARDQAEVDLEFVVRLGVDFGISSMAARIRLEAAGLLTSPKERRTLDEQIGEGEHRDLLYRLGLGELQDSIVEAQEDLPRLPTRLRTNAIGAYEAGLLDIERLARLLRRDADATESDLVEHGVAPAVVDEEPDW